MRRVDSVSARSKEKIERVINKKFKLPNMGKYALVFASILALIILAKSASRITDIATISRLMFNGKFLVVFQNSAELRSTGGFPGSFAVLEINQGRVKKIDFEGNIYKADNAFLETHRIPAPKPFEKIWKDSFMAFNSSNWNFDFSESAEQMKWFYEQEYSDKVDGIIAVNSSVVVELLKITGPVAINSPPITFDSANFMGSIQKYIEKDYYSDISNQNANEPKSIFGALSQEIQTKILRSNPLKLSSLFSRLIDDGDLQFYFSDPIKESSVVNSNYAAEVPDWRGDYLYINNANLGGGKGSLGVEQDISYSRQIEPSKKITSLVKITRKNYGRSDFPVGDNLNYSRVVVPSGSKINYANIDGNSLENIDVENVNNRTVFGFWFNTKVGQTSTATLSYTIEPLKTKRLYIQHQPGSNPDKFSVKTNDSTIFSGDLRGHKIVDIL